MKTFAELNKINVSANIEKKGTLSYLSWTYAVETLLTNDPTATWEFAEPKYIGETVMVFCTVHAMGKSMTMHLPVMDNRNNAVKQPDSRKISDAMMRCLVKCIACFGIGLYIYSGENVPRESQTEDEVIDLEPLIIAIHDAKTMGELKVAYIKAIKAVNGNLGFQVILESAKNTRKIEISNEEHESMQAKNQTAIAKAMGGEE
jgi:hypothetical protein